jgi:hypothetical protein
MFITKQQKEQEKYKKIHNFTSRDNYYWYFNVNTSKSFFLCIYLFLKIQHSVQAC